MKGEKIFQSTLPLRGATPAAHLDPRRSAFQSTLPLRGATLAEQRVDLLRDISIHAPLAGSDQPQGGGRRARRDFNPRSPCGERRDWLTPEEHERQFQSTLPLRGATRPNRRPAIPWPISIHAPLAGSDRDDVRARHELGISIHAPLAGSDGRLSGGLGGTTIFQSTLPLRGATCCTRMVAAEKMISIHAPLAGSDIRYSRIYDYQWKFQSTLPLRGATRRVGVAGGRLFISIHAPLAGSDGWRCCWGCPR